MAELNLVKILEQTLLSVPEYISENGKVLKVKVYEDAMSVKSELIRILLGNKSLKKQFFKEIDGVIVFDKQKFTWLLENREFLPDSYTRYKNKIGLSDGNDNFILNTSDVILTFPYKDCVLLGGQDKDDQKKEEIFFNELVGSEQITRMLAPKVFTNAKRYTVDGIEKDIEFGEDDNLIIKGNNLIVLSSLIERYEGKVKCIYIDPPYNTGSDSFKYNDNFNHSTWLTFIKNRLELAYKLLRKDGTIVVSIDNNEIGYLIILLDEIFGKENQKNIITVKRASASGAKVINPGVVNIAEYVVIYSKDADAWSPNRVFASKDYDNRYNQYITNYDDGYEKWEFSTVLEVFANQTGVKKSQLKKYYGDNYDIELNNFVIANKERIIRFAALDDRQISNETREFKKKSLENPDLIIRQEREGFKDYYFKNGNCILFAKDRIMKIDGNDTFSTPITDIWTDCLPNDLHNEGQVEFKKGKKTEKMLSRIFELCSNPNDIILDFFAGSGSSGATAMKMNRQFILCEQMNYIGEKTVKRLKNVLCGEQRGVSANYDWNGGGSFVYCELMENTNELIGFIEHATEENIGDIKTEIYCDNRIVPYITSEELSNLDNLFEDMELDEKKKALISLVDKNKLYVNYSDIDDKMYNVSESDKKFTESFYKGV